MLNFVDLFLSNSLCVCRDCIVWSFCASWQQVTTRSLACQMTLDS